jgi:transcriptional regulator with XRE-family HTH domain
MDLGITQKEAARRLGTDQFTLINWEKKRTEPAIRFVPGIVQFLGYDPFPKGVTLPERIRATRRARGLSHTALAKEFGVDPSTVLGWEGGRHHPPIEYWPRILGLIGQEELPPEAPLPDRLRGYRRAQGLTQAELGALLGVSQSVVSNWERGKNRPGACSLAGLKKLPADGAVT